MPTSRRPLTTYVSFVIVILSCLAVITVAPATAVGHGTGQVTRESSQASTRNTVADRTVFAVNRQHYRRAREQADAGAIRELRRFRERGFLYFGRSRNDCYRQSAGSWQCPATVRKNGTLRGSAFLIVERPRRGASWKVVDAYVVLGE